MKQLEDMKLVSEQLQFYRAPNMPPKQASINKGVIIGDMLFREGRESQSSSVSTEKSSTLVDQVDETLQAASSLRNKLPQCSSMNYHGHDHEDKRNPQQPVVTPPQDLVTFSRWRQRTTREDAAYRSFQW